MINSVHTGIQYRVSFEVMEALVAAGATVDDLQKYEEGGYPQWFIAKIVAWYRAHILVNANKDDAVARKMKSERKKGK